VVTTNPIEVRGNDVAELPLLQADLSQARVKGRFAIAERTPAGLRVLVLSDDMQEASELARELRRRGVHADAFRTSGR